MKAKAERVLAIAHAILPVIRETIVEVSISGHVVVNGKLLIDYERAGKPFASQIGRTIATSGPKLCKEFFWVNTLGVLTQGKFDMSASHADKADALETVAQLKDPRLDAELTRLKTAARAIIKLVESEVVTSKLDQLRKELRGLITSGHRKFGLDRDVVITTFEEELRILRVEDVNTS